MPKNRYSITEQDHKAARSYIQRKIQADRGWPSANAYQTFSKSSESTSRLNTWCEEHLSNIQWKKLKNAILAARKRERDKKSGKGTRHVDISHDAWRFLTDLAKYEDMTLSEFLVSRLRKEWVDIKVRRIKNDKRD